MPDAQATATLMPSPTPSAVNAALAEATAILPASATPSPAPTSPTSALMPVAASPARAAVPAGYVIFGVIAAGLLLGLLWFALRNR